MKGFIVYNWKIKFFFLGQESASVCAGSHGVVLAA